MTSFTPAFPSSPAPAGLLPGQSIIDWFDARQVLRDAFLRQHGWGDAVILPVGDDCAFRRYLRLSREGVVPVILMEAVPDGYSIATPGHSLHDFVRIGRALNAQGLRTPALYAVDEAEGYILMEDLGSHSFKWALNAGQERDELYGIATDVLMRLHAAAIDIPLPDYYASHVHTGRRRLVDWYMPAVTGRKVGDGTVESYLDVWDEIEQSLPPCPRGFLHIDFHFENLMLLENQSGNIARCGILDFQGAMRGPVPYDLANLLEDARVDVPRLLRDSMLNRFCASMDSAEKAVFLDWYRVLATQFHCRVIGQFIRLAIRDGKDRYLQHIPRVAGYIRDGLQSPVLAPLAEWCSVHGLDFAKTEGFDIDAIRPLIRTDAF